jgi:hypothetical protein
MVTVLNTGKYRIPYLEYDLFGNYIAENLCIKRNEAGNNCQLFRLANVRIPKIITDIPSPPPRMLA